MAEPPTGQFTPRSDERALPETSPCTGPASTPAPTDPWQPAIGAADMPTVAAPDQRGRYTIERLHAQGGIGQVNIAREARLNRQVALKEIRPDRRDAEARRRFLKEAEITGQLEHPGIVPIYALDDDATGEPYYVMRFIQGQTLHEAIQGYHREPSALAFRSLLQRFVSVCQTIAYAHSRGVIHRDLKPANVMLGDYGETLVVDWGLAKRMKHEGGRMNHEPSGGSGSSFIPRPSVLGATLAAPGDATQPGQTLGTPAYMAPEQARGEWERVGPAADIFSLGAILYELLTSQRPLQGKDVLAVMENAAAGRFAPPRKEQANVPKPLEAICLTAMAFAPAERYSTAQKLAEDVEHWLADEAVTAYAERWPERAGRWARKHRAAVTTAAAVLVTATIGLAVGLAFVNAEKNHTELARQAESQAKIEAQAAATAEKAAKVQAQRDRDQKEQQRQWAQAIADFVQNDFLALTSVEGQNRFGGEGKEALSKDTKLVELLDRAADKLRKRHDLDPRTEADLCWIIGVNYRGIGDYAKAVPFLERSLALRREQVGAEDEETLKTGNSLALAYYAAGKLSEAIALYEQVRDAELRTLGVENETTLATLDNLATAYRAADQLPQAIALYEQVRDAKTRRLGADHADTLVTLNNLAVAYHDAGKLPQATALCELVRDTAGRTLGADHPLTWTALHNLAMAYSSTGKLPQAIELYEQAHQGRVKKLGADHPDTLITANSLALAYQAAHRRPDAIVLFEQVRDAQVRKLGFTHPDTLITLGNLAGAYKDAGKLAEAIAILEQIRDAQVQKLGAEHSQTLLAMNNLAQTYKEAGKLPEAITMLEQVRKVQVPKFGVDHPDTLSILSNLAGAYQTAGRSSEAIVLWEQVRAAQVKTLGAEHPRTLTTLSGLAAAYSATGKAPEAIAILEQVRNIRTQNLGAEHPLTLNALNSLATVYGTAGKLPEAIALLQQVHDAQVRTLGADHPNSLLTLFNWGSMLRATGKLADALPLFEEAAAGFEKRAFLHELAAPVLRGTIRGNYEAEQFDKAETWQRKWLAAVKVKAGAESPAYAAELTSLGLIILRQKKWTDAEAVLQEALAVYDQHAPDSWMTFSTKSLLGEAWLGQQKFTEAEASLLAGYEGMKQREAKIPPQSKGRLMATAQGLVSLYDTWGKRNEATKWRRLLAEQLTNALHHDITWSLLWGRPVW